MDREWRLIVDGDGPPAWNMAADEAILRECSRGESPPTLRLYGWSRPAISLGYFQRIESTGIDIDHCADSGIIMVRRLTGGRAVLHGHDLTFSIALREDALPDGCGSIAASHRWLMGGIRAAFEKLGIDAEVGPRRGSETGHRSESADCFAVVAQCDIRLAGNKISGSAQVRKWGALLEQGSIPHVQPSVDYERVFRQASARPCLPLENISRSSLEDAITDEFQRSMGIPLTPDTYRQGESELAALLEVDRYSKPEWTLNRDSTCIDKPFQS